MLVRIVGVGICHTDMTVRDQLIPFPLPAVLGHEGSGVVERVGAGVSKVQAGDHVVLTFGSCGQCAECHNDDPAYCSRFVSFNASGLRASDRTAIYRDAQGEPVHGNFMGQSSFASHALVLERNLVRIASDVPLEITGPLGCGLQSGAGAVLNVLKPETGSGIAVFGCGSVGMAAIMAAKVQGCTTIVAVDLSAQRLATALALGATHAVDASTQDVLPAIAQIARRGLQYSVECSGNARVLRQAVECLKPKGSCALVGAGDIKADFSLNMSFMLNGRSLRGVIEGDSVPDVFIPQLVELWRQQRFPFDKLLRLYDFDDINQAVADAENGIVFKPILRPSMANAA